jgi:hypothetical protein
MDATANNGNQPDPTRQRLAQIVARFGPRTHLQPKEIAELIGLKTARPVNAWIKSGALLAKIAPGCDRLRFVDVVDYLAFMHADGPVAPVSGPAVRFSLKQLDRDAARLRNSSTPRSLG